MRRDDEPINREQIVRAALEIVDGGGDGALSMRAVASKVDRHVSSLYNHVRNRAELVDLLSADIVRSIRVDCFATLDWPAALSSWSRSYVEAFVAHPNMVQILAVAPVRDLPTLVMYETILQSLTRQGWPLRDAVHAIRTVEAHAWGSVFDLVSAEPDLSSYEAEPGLEMVRTALSSLAPAEYGGWASYEAGLDALIAGLESRHGALLPRGAGSTR